MKVKLYKEESSFNMIIPVEVERKIRWMCQHISTIEWSGTLFYELEGKYEDDTLVIKCVDFFPMDIGSAAYTEFDMSPDVIGYMTDNPDLLNCQIGLIHSHNNMATFFSGTDTATLLEEGKDRNHFVSLIVNNAGTYTAGITRLEHTISKITEERSFHTFQDKIVNLGEDSYISEELSVIWRNLKVIKEEDANTQFPDLENRLKEINELKESKAAKIRDAANSNLYNPATKTYYGDYRNKGMDNDLDSYEIGAYGVYNNPISSIPTQLTLPFEEEDYTKFDMNIIIKTVKQLITGSIILPNNDKINIKEWAKNMVPLFDARFKNIKDFEDWAEGYIDFLVWDLEDPKLSKSVDAPSIGSAQMVEVLKELPENKYITIFITILNNYICEEI